MIYKLRKDCLLEMSVYQAITCRVIDIILDYILMGKDFWLSNLLARLALSYIIPACDRQNVY